MSSKNISAEYLEVIKELSSLGILKEEDLSNPRVKWFLTLFPPDIKTWDLDSFLEALRINSLGSRNDFYQQLVIWTLEYKGMSPKGLRIHLMRCLKDYLTGYFRNLVRERDSIGLINSFYELDETLITKDLSNLQRNALFLFLEQGEPRGRIEKKLGLSRGQVKELLTLPLDV